MTTVLWISTEFLAWAAASEIAQTYRVYHYGIWDMGTEMSLVICKTNSDVNVKIIMFPELLVLVQRASLINLL